MRRAAAAWRERCAARRSPEASRSVRVIGTAAAMLTSARSSGGPANHNDTKKEILYESASFTGRIKHCLTLGSGRLQISGNRS